MERKYDAPPLFLGVDETEDAVVDSFMEGSVRASYLGELCDALRLRIRALREEIKRTAPSPARQALEDRFADARKQLAVLRQEQAISQFVEDSVRVTLRNETMDVIDEDEFE